MEALNKMMKLGFVQKPSSIHWYVGFKRGFENASTLHVDFFIDGDGVMIYRSNDLPNEETFMDDKLLKAIITINKELKKNWEKRKVGK
jgi:hypothetical protein